MRIVKLASLSVAFGLVAFAATSQTLVAKKSIKGVRAHRNYGAALYKGLDIEP